MTVEDRLEYLDPFSKDIKTECTSQNLKDEIPHKNNCFIIIIINDTDPPEVSNLMKKMYLVMTHFCTPKPIKQRHLHKLLVEPNQTEPGKNNDTDPWTSTLNSDYT